MTPRNVMLMTRTLGHGGTERQLTEIALSLDRSVFRPHVCCASGEGFRADELRRNGVPILELPVPSLFSPECLKAAIRLRRYLRLHRIELVHTFDTSMNVFGAPVARLFGGPVVLSSQRCFENVIWPRHRWLTRVAHRMADGVVVNCGALEEHLVRDYSIPRSKIHVCPNGLDTSVFRPPENGRTRPSALRDASLVIGVVCVLRPEKDLSTLLEAFARVRDVRPGLKLAIVGSGPVRESLEARAGELGITEDCIFAPATEDVVTWLHAIDIFVLPSLSEAFSNSLMEAMACGCCAVASNVGGNPELVRSGETGLLFEPGNAADLAVQLRTLIQEDASRARLAAAGAAWVAANLSRETSARRMGEIYRAALDWR
jgi:glycosyltransferase involved in cell wall biosynthesis